MEADHQYLDVGMERWIQTTARRNHWRVQRWMSVEDLVQEGYYCYVKCHDRYGVLRSKRKPRKEDRRHFMSLVQRAYMNRITDLAEQRTATPETNFSGMIAPGEEPTDWLEHHIGSATHPLDGALIDLQATIDKAPRQIRTLLAVLSGDVNAGLDYACVKLKRTGLIRRETTNAYLCRLVGLNPKTVDIEILLRQYFHTRSQLAES